MTLEEFMQYDYALQQELVRSLDYDVLKSLSIQLETPSSFEEEDAADAVLYELEQRELNMDIAEEEEDDEEYHYPYYDSQAEDEPF